MGDARPFASFGALTAAADRSFDALTPEDWMEAFASHPRLGEKKNVHQSDTANAWSASEQSRVEDAEVDTKRTLAELNERYFQKYGFTFILCASGRSAAEMVDSVRSRLGNSKEEERRIAAGEQRKITRLRLERLVLA
jgi:OHCU decarboxylase